MVGSCQWQGLWLVLMVVVVVVVVWVVVMLGSGGDMAGVCSIVWWWGGVGRGHRRLTVMVVDAFALWCLLHWWL